MLTTASRNVPDQTSTPRPSAPQRSRRFQFNAECAETQSTAEKQSAAEKPGTQLPRIKRHVDVAVEPPCWTRGSIIGFRLVSPRWPKFVTRSSDGLDNSKFKEYAMKIVTRSAVGRLPGTSAGFIGFYLIARTFFPAENEIDSMRPDAGHQTCSRCSASRHHAVRPLETHSTLRQTIEIGRFHLLAAEAEDLRPQIVDTNEEHVWWRRLGGIRGTRDEKPAGEYHNRPTEPTAGSKESCRSHDVRYQAILHGISWRTGSLASVSFGENAIAAGLNAGSRAVWLHSS